MLIATTEAVAGHEVVETLGEVFGITVLSRSIVGQLGAALNSIVDGEITDFTRPVQEGRAHAIDRMVAEANLRGADAVAMMRFDSGEISQGITEIVACGTAVMPKRVA
ncbi:MAG: heavy metal-binding domain-containing protein [Alphaproteobacteria bacterium]